MNTTVGVKRHEGKIRIAIDTPVEGDAELVRKQHWDLPAQHALALAAGIVNEVGALLQGLAKTPERAADHGPPRPPTTDSDVAASDTNNVPLPIRSTGNVTNGTE